MLTNYMYNIQGFHTHTHTHTQTHTERERERERGRERERTNCSVAVVEVVLYGVDILVPQIRNVEQLMIQWLTKSKVILEGAVVQKMGVEIPWSIKC